MHGKEIALEKLRAYKSDYDHVFILGDCTNDSASFMVDVLDCFPNAYIIPGNNEDTNVLEILYKAMQYAHEKRFELKERYNIVGFGFSNPTPFHTPGELEDDEIYSKLIKLNINEKTILLVHAPPYGVLDEIKGIHIGSKAIRKIVEEKQPYIVFCAHLHEVIGVEKLEKTLIVKVPAAMFLKFCICEIKNNTICIQFKEMQP